MQGALSQVVVGGQQIKSQEQQGKVLGAYYSWCQGDMSMIGCNGQAIAWSSIREETCQQNLLT